MRVLVTGGTGFIGRRIVERLARRGDEVTVVTRSPERTTAPPGVRLEPWLPSLSGQEGVVHLAGEPIFGKRWSAAQKERIRESRIEGSRRIADSLHSADPRPRVVVSASAIGIYGDRDDAELDETAGHGDDFLARVCQAWEGAFDPARDLGVRVVHPRIGIVLGRDGGALELMLPIFKLGLGGPLGSGRQWMSWVHVDDVVGLVLHALDDDGAAGPLNATAPHPVRNREFTRTLGRVLKRPALLPAPRFALRAALGEVTDVLFGSQRCAPKATNESGYAFAHPDLEPALRDLLG